MPKPYSIDINLDDPDTCLAFEEIVKDKRPEQVAELLELPKNDSRAIYLAGALMAYAFNKAKAISCRKSGTIKTALYREQLCDTIYKVRIAPVCDCW